MLKRLLLSLVLLFNLYLMQSQMNTHKASINHLAIYVVDLKASASFYEGIIGLDSIPEPFHDGKHVWLRIGPSIALHIIQGSDSKKDYYKNNHICFSVASVEQFTARLREKGI